MIARIIPAEFEGQAVSFTSDGWINATTAASLFGQEPRDWLRLHETEAYARALAKRLSIPFEPRLIKRRSSSKVSGGNSGFRPELSNCAGLVITKRGSTNNGGGTWLHPKLAVAFARWLSPDFAVWCDMQMDALLRSDNSKWEQVRQQSATSYRGMCAALAVTLEAAGRQPKAHHFMNEARLINEVVAGVFSGRDRDQLSEGELALITLMEVRNVLLLGQGKTYQERKDGLLSYVATIRGARLEGAA
ncbi:KilA-N domain-containing protein [Pseudomonas nitroreducens]|uniref:KilA-N domain-containing protein n=1 Tax=Pseudomonas nitroreducens TaxID=46680 RepID=UPI00037EED35|nr:KilA-N domain-containing protein [Pseudomonas nitroreducens]